ncbi:MAG: hypothetical protein CL916_10130 [Deltaproteobacteria bacterium]|nr:hypothetical protein [Deltaproteobacteria bacterium]
MNEVSPDVVHLFSILKQVEERSKILKWAKTRPWRRSTHIWYESELLVVDLHDLNTKLAKESIHQCLDTLDEFETGALCFVTGMGKNSPGNVAKNRKMVMNLLRKKARKKESWSIHSPGMGRITLVFNPDKAPRSATGQLAPELKFAIGLFAFMLVFSMLHSCWPQ